MHAPQTVVRRRSGPKKLSDLLRIILEQPSSSRITVVGQSHHERVHVIFVNSELLARFPYQLFVSTRLLRSRHEHEVIRLATRRLVDLVEAFARLQPIATRG